MTRLTTRSSPPRTVWQLEQQGMHPLLARLYAARGVTDKSELDYELKSLLPPALLTHAAEAAVLLADAIEAQAKILIVADYDCDGATACAVGIRALRAMSSDSGAHIDYLVPNRFTYGYGLTPGIVDWKAGWWHGKMLGLVTMTILHHDLALARKRFARDANTRSERGWRLTNEIPTVALILIVVMVITKPF